MTTLTPDERPRFIQAHRDLNGLGAVDESLTNTLADHLGRVWQRDMHALGRVLPLVEMPAQEQQRLLRIARTAIKELREGD